MMKRKLLLNFLSACVLLLSSGASGAAAELRIAVASNFSETLHDLIPLFKESGQNKIVLISGSSGKLYAQIKNGAPFDLFLSADEEFPRKLIEANLADSASRATYASGVLVLWSARPKSLEHPETLLRQGRFAHLAIPNPKTAPYGRAALEVLHALKIPNDLQNKWVVGESVSQAFQFAQTRSAEFAFVAQSQVIHLSQGSIWRVPKSLYQPILQDAVIMNRTSQKDLSKKFLAFLLSPVAQHTIQNAGYEGIVHHD